MLDGSDDPLQGHPLYERIVKLGRAPTGSTFTQVARKKKTGELVSIKFLRRGWGKDVAASLLNANFNHMELSVCSHPHIVEFKEAFLLRDYLAIVMEYVEGETVETFLERVGGKVIESLAKFIFQQLIIAVDFCHRRGKLLRDIKPSTLLLSIREGTLPLLKLCDFAVSKDMTRRDAAGGGNNPEASGGGSDGQVGSALFVAPEAMQDPTGTTHDGRAADIWSCAVVTYICLFGRHPFIRDEDEPLGQTEKLIAMLQRTLKDEAGFVGQGLEDEEKAALPPSAVSDACRDLLGGLLVCDPTQRLTIAQIMKHPWFLEGLPSGADVMNDLLVQDCPQLTPAQVACFQALIKKASIDDKDSGVEAPVTGAPHRLASSSGLASKPPISPSQDSSSSNRHRLVLDNGHSWLGNLPASSEGAPARGAAPSPQAGSIPARRILQAAAAAGAAGAANGRGGVIPSPGSNHSGSSGSLLGRIVNGLASPGPLSSASGLSDALMRVPTEVLLRAAVEDIVGAGPDGAGRGMVPGADFGVLPSPVAPRSDASRDRALMSSPSFLQEVQLAGLMGNDGGGGGGTWLTEGLGVAASRRRTSLMGSGPKGGGGLQLPGILSALRGGGEGGGSGGDTPIARTNTGGLMNSLSYVSATDLWAVMASMNQGGSMAEMAGMAGMMHAGSGCSDLHTLLGHSFEGGELDGGGGGGAAPPGQGVGAADALNWQMQADLMTFEEGGLSGLHGAQLGGPSSSAPMPLSAAANTFPMWDDSPDTVPLASLSAMDMSFDWGSFGGQAMDGGAPMVAMDSSWGRICQASAHEHAMQQMRQRLNI